MTVERLSFFLCLAGIGYGLGWLITKALHPVMRKLLDKAMPRDVNLLKTLPQDKLSIMELEVMIGYFQGRMDALADRSGATQPPPRELQ